MKTQILNKNKGTLLIALVLINYLCFLANPSMAQLPRVAVLNPEIKGLALTSEQCANLLRIQLYKMEKYEVVDKYDVKTILEKNGINEFDCFGNECAIKAGKALRADKVVTGTAEKFGDRIIIALRLVDITSGSVEKTKVNEFLNQEQELHTMFAITINDIFRISNDEKLVTRLTKENTYESSTTNPGVERLALTGPRMGVTVVSGRSGRRIMSPQGEGGFDAYPLMTQFGYQFETQYLNSGNFQALIEYIPLITGIDQGFFNPSLTILNGFRNNKSGFEFAFGPTIGITKLASGYYTDGNVWHLESDWHDSTKNPNSYTAPNPYNIIDQPDYRGDLKFVTGFVIAAGKTFKSGKLNIPINAYIVPDKNGFRYGLNFGFNTRR